MPIVITVADLRPGMRLAESIIAHGTVMYSGGRTLAEDDVAILQRRFGRMHVRVGDPLLDDVVEFEDDSKEREVAGTVQHQIASAMSNVTERFSSR